MLLTNYGILFGMNKKIIEIFGKCSNHNWHGHNYELHVTVKGTPHEDTGYCMDMKDSIRYR